MKYLSKKILICGLLAGGLFTACNKSDLTDLNNNPQALSSINLNFIFTTAELGAASGGAAGDNRYIDWRTNIGMASYAIQQLATISNISPGNTYTHNPETAAAPFEFIYGDELKNLGIVLKESGPGGFGDGQYNNTRQAARILRAFLFERLTDYYGSVPYSEALQADAGVFFPKYDKQKDIYADLFKELDEATAAFGAADGAFSSADLYFKGDISKWKKFGYSLMLRMAMRLSEVDVSSTNTYVAKAVAGGVFTSSDDNVLVQMAVGPSQWVDQNGISRAFYPGDGGQPTFMSKTFIDWLKGPNKASTTDDDPRLMVLSAGIGSWTVNGGVSTWTPTDVNPLNQKGMPNGADFTILQTMENNPNLNIDATYSKINPALLDLDDPYMLMNYGEVELMLAEASERGFGGLTAATAAAHYIAGVKASMQMYTIYDPSLAISDAVVAAYLASHPYGVAKPALEMIGDQYWANHFLNWWEAWSNWRRTTYPTLTPVNYPGNVTNGTIPQRLVYPTAESGGNPGYASGSTKPDDYTTKLWWAGGPE